ncbi:MAG: hypothetical protein D6693_09890 [Planctomycetota bacterium]|nr:MAG: hypothetical protein D6693_09890 [Planctomycetota bacterium]
MPHRPPLIRTLVATLALSAPAGAQLRDVFPHVRVDTEAKVVEIDGAVPIFVHDPDAPDVYLEVIVCTPDTKEHESLVVTRARPSHVHAALLMIGLNPGRPGHWTWSGDGADARLTAHDPEGDAVRVSLHWTDADGRARSADPSAWITHHDTGEKPNPRAFVFAGSRMMDRGFGRGEMYDADGAGVLVGLATFGSEVVAWPETFSPDSGVDEPVWVADPATTPPIDTPVRVRFTPAGG